MKQVWTLPWRSAEKSTQDQYLNVGFGSHEHWLRESWRWISHAYFKGERSFAEKKMNLWEVLPL